MRSRVFAGGIATETNVFSPMPTGLGDFAVTRPEDPQRIRDQILGGWAFSRFASAISSRGSAYVQGSYAAAQPAGVTTRAAYETLRTTLLSELEQALPLDAVLLSLHGAMVAAGYEDCETDIAWRVRDLVGPDVTIGILLDLHCDIPADLVDAADVIVAYKEYPHTDIGDRAEELAALVIDAAHTAADPVMATYDCRMIGIYPTPLEPMRGFVQKMKDAERRPGVLSVSLGHGFPWGDAPGIGARALAVTDGDPSLAEAVAVELGRDFYALRREVTLDPLPLTAALDHALAAATTDGPIVVADVADNAGGGAPSDSTFALRELLDRRVQDAGLAVLWDPIAVQQAISAGEGARLRIRLGGKMGSFSGEPLDLQVEVRGVVKGLVQFWPQTTGHVAVPCGDCAHLVCEGIDVIVGSVRQQVLGVEVFTAFEIDPRQLQLLVVKSGNHFRAAFDPIASEIVYATSDGALTFDFGSLPYERFGARAFPIVDDPWATNLTDGD